MSITEKHLQEMHKRLSQVKSLETGAPKTPDGVPGSLKAWEELADYPRFGEVAAIHQGIAYRIPIKGNEEKLLTNTPRPGFARGLYEVTDDFAPYEVTTSTYLNTNSLWQ